MRWFKRGALALTLGLVLVLCAAGAYIWRSLPQLDGALKAAGLQAPVHIGRDASDVTHIRASSTHDAYWALGYTHAQERSWQLEFNRRTMHGELSEILGPATLETDRFLRTLGIMRAAQKQWEGLPPQAQQALQAYADGINAFHQTSGQALPPEFHILGVKPGLWTPQDSVGWSIIMALDLGGNWSNEFARLSVMAKVNTAHQWQLFPPYPGEQPASSVDLAKLYTDLGVYRSPAAPVPGVAALGAPETIATKQDSTPAHSPFDLNLASRMRTQMAQGVVAWARELGNIEGKGSNNWVVAGSHTASGKPLLANDPHLGLSAPAIWYFARLQAPGMDVEGATLPGLPFVVLGRTAQVAWGFTNTGPDVQDLYLEQIDPANPARYRTPEGWAEFASHKETIRIKGQGDATFVVRETRHGPVLSDAQKVFGEVMNLDRYALALRWSALDPDNQTVASGLAANRARSVDELLAAYANYHSPKQNVVMADTSGRIFYKAVGKVPLRRPDNDIRGMAPAPGWDARYDWSGWLPYDQTPQSDGADKGWVATANQRITPPGYPYFLGADWTTPERFDRIEQMLAATPKQTVQSFAAMQADQLSLATLTLWPVLQASLQSGSVSFPALAGVRQAFQGFDGVMRADNAAPLMFAAWADELARGLVTPKLGEAGFKRIYGRRHLRTTVENIMASNDAYWCGPQGCPAQSDAALARALQRLSLAYGSDPAQWRWGTAHPAVSVHRPFSSVKPLARWFEVRVPTGGDPFTVNVGQYWLNEAEPFANRHAASMRAIYDLSDLENSRFIYQTGQSGNVFSSRYRDMAQEWAAVQYRPLKMQTAVMVHDLVLNP